MPSLDSKVTPINNSSKPTVEDVERWLENFSKRGELGASSARLRATSIRNLATVLAEDEPQDVVYILTNLDALERRWATLNPDKQGDTARTYSSRARTTIEAFLGWQADPAGFKFPRLQGAEGNKSARKRPARVAEDPAPVASPPPTPPAAPTQGTLRSFPLDREGSEFRFELPSRPLTMRDVRRVAIHLASFAVDFDPESPTEAQVFGLSVNRGGE